MQSNAANEWQSRPLLSRMLRAAIVVVPVGASMGLATLMSALLPHATSWQMAVMWMGVVAALSLAALVLLERMARKLLPLAALLNVSLIFPDQAPRRFAMARQVGSPRDLQQRLTEARARGEAGDATALQSVVELVLALSVHDRTTRGHSERVRVYTEMIADELKLDPVARNKLRWAALLHDIGKLEVPVAVLNKTTPLTDQDWHAIHQHPERGAELISPLLPWLGEWGHAVAQHHERFDGTGYPNRLAGKDIALAARIVAVADSYEVMTAPRPYKRAMSVKAARRELTRVAGTQLDPDIVRAFLNVSVGRLWRTVGVGMWLGQLPVLTRLLQNVTSIGGLAVPTGTATLPALGLIAVSGYAVAAPLHTMTPAPQASSVASTDSVRTGGSPGAAGRGSVRPGGPSPARPPAGPGGAKPPRPPGKPPGPPGKPPGPPGPPQPGPQPPPPHPTPAPPPPHPTPGPPPPKPTPAPPPSPPPHPAPPSPKPGPTHPGP